MALLVGVSAPIAGAYGLPAVGWLDQTVVNVTGVGLAVAGIALTLAAQLRMGSEWRIGVDEAAMALAMAAR